jgi:excisionase family DNA binding protein
MRSEAEHRGDALTQLNKLGRVTVPNAAVLLGLHAHTVRAYIRDGKIEAITLGSRPYIMRAEIFRYQAHGPRNPLASSESEAENLGGGV